MWRRLFYIWNMWASVDIENKNNLYELCDKVENNSYMSVRKISNISLTYCYNQHKSMIIKIDKSVYLLLKNIQ